MNEQENASADTTVDTTPKRPWTPGPWPLEYSDYGDELWFGGSGCGLYSIGQVASFEAIAYVGGSADIPDKKPIMEANACLIAAAPELFEALERLLLFSESHELSGQYGQAVLDELFEIETQARAAIEKAEGGQP